MSDDLGAHPLQGEVTRQLVDSRLLHLQLRVNARPEHHASARGCTPGGGPESGVLLPGGVEQGRDLGTNKNRHAREFGFPSCSSASNVRSSPLGADTVCKSRNSFADALFT